MLESAIYRIIHYPADTDLLRNPTALRCAGQKFRINLSFWETAHLPFPQLNVNICVSLGSLSSDIFERRTSTGSEPFSLLISLDATVFLLPSVLILIETICPKIYSKSRLKSAKRPLPVDVRRSKTSLLKLPILQWIALPLFVFNNQGQAPIVQKLNRAIHRIQWINIREINCVIHWIEIYPANSVRQRCSLINNWDQKPFFTTYILEKNLFIDV